MPFRIGEDLPQQISRARTDLYPFFNECLDNEKQTYFKNDYLVVDGNKYTYDQQQKKPVLMTQK